MATSCVPVATAAGACANCGREGGDGVKLKNCTACLLVKYCGVDCQKAHRKQHKKACTERAAELKDERLYGQGHERPERDFCPICTLPVQLPTEEHACVDPCCMKQVCNGCALASMKMGINGRCEFCRTPRAKNDAESLARIQARVGKNDPDAISYLGDQYSHGRLGLEKDAARAVELWTEAAKLGSAEACFQLGVAYSNGDGVEQDVKWGVWYYEKAAMLGDPVARHNLGCYECELGRYDRAVRHLLISAAMGDENSLEDIKKLFKEGHATKSQYAEALKGYRDATEEMKSPDREAFDQGTQLYEKAAMLGNSSARQNLGYYECERGRYDRGVRHLLISAKMGQAVSIENIKKMFKGGHATKSQYAEALKGYHDAVEEMKSPVIEKKPRHLPFGHQLTPVRCAGGVHGEGLGSGARGRTAKDVHITCDAATERLIAGEGGRGRRADGVRPPFGGRQLCAVHPVLSGNCIRVAEGTPQIVGAVPLAEAQPNHLPRSVGAAIGRATHAPTPTSARTSPAGPRTMSPVGFEHVEPAGALLPARALLPREVDLDGTPREREVHGHEAPGAAQSPSSIVPASLRWSSSPRGSGDRHRPPSSRATCSRGPERALLPASTGGAPRAETLLLRSPGEHRVELAQHRVDAGSRSPSSPIGPTDAAVPLDLLLDGDSTESSRPPPPVLGVPRLVSSSSTPLTPLSVLNDRGSLSRAKGHPQPLSPLPAPSNSTTDPLAARRSASSPAVPSRESRPAENTPPRVTSFLSAARTPPRSRRRPTPRSAGPPTPTPTSIQTSSAGSTDEAPPSALRSSRRAPTTRVLLPEK
ncbi:hypothetical protein THAOC_10563 [Thalassiosira oceanica]|uniref:MYND-type domain-containing protein n=1 Tax=Thalassiosira oceanica TaxID=159749 RepID=K0SPQ7_THAOC|nr:hypothetical protein THAOC_10563 [Thalassiosira oceanica]|eukprot:EJK68273.1 hypothetical protein THAOC_10563 [Thalassiosira oceanica]